MKGSELTKSRASPALGDAFRNRAHGVAQRRKPAELAAAGIDGDEETIAATNCADAILAVVNGEFGLWG